MTVIDFFNSPGYSSLIQLGISFIVLGISVHAAVRMIGIKEGLTKAFYVSFIVIIFSLVRAVISLDTFFLAIFLGAIGIFTVKKVYLLNSIQSLYVLVVSVVVYIVLRTVLAPIIFGGLF